MIRILIELIMFGCTIFTIIHIIKTLKSKKRLNETKHQSYQN